MKERIVGTSGERGFEDALSVGRRLGLMLPDSGLIEEAYGHARAESAPWLFNHVVRSWLFGAKLAQQRAVPLDPEVFATAVLLHDLGLARGGAPDRRFEVLGADLGRAFALAHGIDDRRAETVWDAIALHTTGSIAQHKGSDVACCHLGIACDFGGVGLSHLADDDRSAIVSAFPRLRMKGQLTTCLTGIVTNHPGTTSDNFLADFGERYVAGYARPSAVDLLQQSPFAE